MPTRSLDFGKSLTFIFEEPEWIKKYLIGVGLVLVAIPLAFLFVIPSFIPIFMLMGYTFEMSRRKAQNMPTVLPEWEGNWGKYLKDGASFSLATLIYTLPLVVPIIGFACATIATADFNGEVSGIVAVLGFAISCLTIVYIIPMFLFLYGGLVEYLRTGEFRSYFAFRNMAAFKSESDGNPRKNFILVLLMIAIPLSMAGSIIPVLGNVWGLYVQGHLLGQVLQQTGYELSTSETPKMVNTL